MELEFEVKHRKMTELILQGEESGTHKKKFGSYGLKGTREELKNIYLQNLLVLKYICNGSQERSGSLRGELMEPAQLFICRKHNVRISLPKCR